ncbi:hypothetical protein [Clostridium vitabionis]|uniref:hypothetical protein n=1 Tax=Clostridium vitabionis TaxID=2784388 RepID=UPI00188BB665|nr:hypothetical protein [Clostridium vitabionis]
METYRHYFDIDPDYFPAVNEKVINDNPDMWKKFYPHKTFISLLKTTINVINRKQKLSIWVEGAYGTGKSHAVLTLKKLLDAGNDEAEEYFNKYGLDNDLKNNFKQIKSSGRILTVHRYGSSNIHGDNDLVFAIQESIEKAFEKAGLENKGQDSLKEAIIRYLSDDLNKQSFNILVTKGYANLFGGDDVDSIVTKLREYSGESLHALMEKIFKVAHDRQIRAFSMTPEDLTNWIKEVIRANNLKAIVFIWDEFTEYFLNNSRNLTGFQQILELSETEPFYFVLVTHVSAGLFPEGDKDYIKLNGRFVAPHSQISLPENIAFQLMGAAMEKTNDPAVLQEWDDMLGDLIDRTKNSRKVIGNAARIKDEEMTDILPIHPYTAMLLKHISQVFDSNQRSMFDFIKNDRGDEIKGFQWFIDNYGPDGGKDSDNPLLTVDMLWEFFYDKGRDSLAHDVRTVLDYYERTANRGLDSEEKRILKAVLLLQAISQHAADAVEMFIPNDKNLELSFEGSDLENKAVHIADKLVRDKILYKKSLGNGKFQYNAYINEISGAELDKFKKEIDKKSTSALITEQLNDNSTVSDALTLDDAALKLRYKIQPVSATDFDSTIRRMRNLEEESVSKIPAVICYAKDDNESILLGKKIQSAIQDGSYHLIFIDATLTPFGQDGYNQYRDEMAQSMYQTGKDNGLASQYARNAKEALKKWKERISAGEFIVFTEKKPAGERATSKKLLENILQEIDHKKFPDCLEAEYNVLPTMYTPTSLKLGVECGVNRKTRQTFSSGNVHTKLETALKDAWDDSVYWETHPNILISKIKIAVDNEIKSRFQSAGRISIREIYDFLKGYPYGFMPCNLSAFIIGFVLKEYTDGTYSWSDGLSNDALTLDRLKEMIDEVIKLQITPNNKYKDKYIVALTAEEKAFNESSATAFNVSKSLCTSAEQTRGVIRNKMKEYGFPIWTLKELIPETSFKTQASVISSLIDEYTGIANNGNLSSTKTDSDIANEIGKLYIDNPDAAAELQVFLTKDNCTRGMEKYLQRYDAGKLPSLANEIRDGGQYINAVRRKFDADASTWVWSIDTANQKIEEVILEYQIVGESNKILPRNSSYAGTLDAWISRCNNIKIAFSAARDSLGGIEPFVEMLYNLKRSGRLSDEQQKQQFLDLLKAEGEAFERFYRNQTDLFQKVCEYYLNAFDNEEIQELFNKIPSSGTFVMDKSAYFTMVDNTVKDYRDSLGYAQLKKFWRDKTHSATPREWSLKHQMPILAVVPADEITKARDAFGTLNRNHPDAASVARAKEYLETTDIFAKLSDNDALDQIFVTEVIDNYAVLLTDINEVKQYLTQRVPDEPYDWFQSPVVNEKLRQMAEAKYNQSGSARALKKIDEMDVDAVKRYLKELIRDNMIVGMEIIKGN